MGVPSLCHCTSSGVAFIAAGETVSNKLEQNRDSHSQIHVKVGFDGRRSIEVFVMS
jgi:hypothetical protein